MDTRLRKVAALGDGVVFERSWAFYPSGYNVMLVLRPDEQGGMFLDVVNGSDVVPHHPCPVRQGSNGARVGGRGRAHMVGNHYR